MRYVAVVFVLLSGVCTQSSSRPGCAAISEEIQSGNPETLGISSSLSTLPMLPSVITEVTCYSPQPCQIHNESGRQQLEIPFPEDRVLISVGWFDFSLSSRETILQRSKGAVQFGYVLALWISQLPEDTQILAFESRVTQGSDSNILGYYTRGGARPNTWKAVLPVSVSTFVELGAVLARAEPIQVTVTLQTPKSGPETMILTVEPTIERWFRTDAAGSVNMPHECNEVVDHLNDFWGDLYSSPVEEQLQMYVCESLYFRESRLRFFDPFADGGDRMIDPLIRRLERIENDAERGALCSAFSLMNPREIRPDVRDRAVGAVRAALAKFGDSSGARSKCEEALARLAALGPPK